MFNSSREDIKNIVLSVSAKYSNIKYQAVYGLTMVEKDDFMTAILILSKNQKIGR